MKQNKNRPVKPELLAPAGSLESFNAAIEAGADAVYLGVSEMNARLRARNFSIKNLSYLVNQARNQQVKIYVTVNTLVKQEEIKSVLDLLYQLQQIRIDAMIVQDLGLAYIARTYFPDLTLHASTQMVIHNSLGLQAAEKLGIKRAVLSRELSLDEINRIKQESPLELEVFIHGALCYSISGLCLASSFIGGWSGNRGRCTQVCRRKFNSEKNTGFYFSPKDFWAVDHIQDLSEIGISSFKIEGRMKRAEYVYNVVSAYRKLLDGKADLEEVKADLLLDMGREKTSFFLKSPETDDIIVSSRPSGTGLLAGKILITDGQSIEIESDLKIQPGDSLRVQNREGDDGVSFTVDSVTFNASNQVISSRTLPIVGLNDQVFLISHKQNKNTHWNKFDENVKATRYQTRYPKAQKILKSLDKLKSSSISEDQLFVKIDNPGWLNILKSINPDFLIISGNCDFFTDLFRNRKQLNYWKNKLVPEFPPFIPETELKMYQKLVSELSDFGVQNWMSSHYSHKLLFPEGDCVFSGSLVWITNQASQLQLIDSGYQGFIYSLEDDLLNIKAMSNANGIMPVYGYIPLFISRIKPPVESSRVEDSKGLGFVVKEHNGLFYTLNDQPACLFHRREKLNGLGMGRFLIDFSFVEPSRKTCKSIFYDYEKGQKTQGTTLFNHKSGFK